MDRSRPIPMATVIELDAGTRLKLGQTEWPWIDV
jgi:hypothetical protein